jgi:hypothetical protein
MYESRRDHTTRSFLRPTGQSHLFRVWSEVVSDRAVNRLCLTASILIGRYSNVLYQGTASAASP